MLTLVSTEHDDDAIARTYACDVVVACAGDSIWSNTQNKQVRITGIYVREEDDYKIVNVTHDATWDIYTDTGFEQAVSKLLGYDVEFTEQGMQEDNLASMEA